MNKLIQYLFIVIILGCMMEACKKPDEQLPIPDEPELITTVRIKATDAGNEQDVHYFSYKVDNGFHGTSQVNFHVDTIKLQANKLYDIELFVLDETKSPVKDVTPEIIDEKNAHLFYYTSLPATGAGAILVSDKDKDHNGQDFARVCKWQTGASGNGVMEIILIHGPRNKEASDRNGIAGSTDAETTFPVQLY